MTRRLAICIWAVAAATQLSGCSSFLLEGGSAGAGIAGSAIAGAVTSNAAVATGIGIGVQAVTRAGIQYEQRKIHGEAQQQIAKVAGALKVGQVQSWKTGLSLPIEPVEAGRVTVSRVISSGELDCKEIVISIEQSGNEKLPVSEFYVASICRSGKQWGWASAEPATARWGSLQ
ncbi:MAG: hypothetical protein JWQ73_2530 [Variovorax sp.]|nr:hypothetical protein [Variovorax sp.]